MRSGWFWGTEHWQRYEKAYAASSPHYVEQVKSSPLAHDHNFDDLPVDWVVQRHETQVVDLTMSEADLWKNMRASYHGLIHAAERRFGFLDNRDAEAMLMGRYKDLHHEAFGPVRSDETFAIQEAWLKDGYGMLELAWSGYIEIDRVVAGAYWIVYRNAAYYHSGPSVEKSVQHAVIWRSLLKLKSMKVRLVEMGPTAYTTDKERGIAFFKQGFGGTIVPYYVAERRTST